MMIPPPDKTGRHGSAAGDQHGRSREEKPGQIRIIRPQLFEDRSRLICGMSTRIGGVSPEPFGMNTSFRVGDDPERVRENRRRFLSVLGVPENQLAIPEQVHGDCVRLVTCPGRYEACDGLITVVRGVFLSVSVADCIPIFLFDPSRGAVGIVHSGWRGTKSGILSRALRMLLEGSSNPEDILAFIGPGAGACCYEVGEDVALQFLPDFVRHDAGAKPRLDLQAANHAMLLAAGVREKNVEVSDLCTINHPELLHSFRRDGPTSGRMMAVIGLG